MTTAFCFLSPSKKLLPIFLWTRSAYIVAKKINVIVKTKPNSKATTPHLDLCTLLLGPPPSADIKREREIWVCCWVIIRHSTSCTNEKHF